MTPEDRRHAAQAVLSIPFFTQLVDEIEKTAVDGCVNAKYDDHEARQAHAAEARSIRRIRSQLVALSKDGDTRGGRTAPA